MNIVIYICFLFFITIKAYSVEIVVDPISVDKIGGSLGDIVCRIDKNPDIYKDNDIVTWAHEGTHAVNSRLRRSGVDNAYYLLNWVGIGISHPDMTLRDLAKIIPIEDRGKIYDIYLIQAQEYWNETPLYIVDELVAYTNGCVVALENKLYKRGLDSYTRALEMYRYSMIAYRECEKQGYKDIKEFNRLLRFIQKRLKNIEEILKENLK